MRIYKGLALCVLAVFMLVGVVNLEALGEEPAAGIITEDTQEAVTESLSETAQEPAAEGVRETAKETEAETEYSNGHRVAIDPGHQGSWVDMSAPEPAAPGSSQTKARCTTGTAGNFTGVPEYQLNLDISLALRTELEQRGYEVILTREDNDANISNSERALLAAEKGGEVYVRIHANSSTDPSINGALAMTMSQQNPYVGALYERSYALASAILEAYCKTTGFANLGIQLTDDMTGINWSKLPVMILEMGFMSNQSDDTLMQDPAMQAKMVLGIADGIDDYFRLPHDAAQKAREAAASEKETAGEEEAISEAAGQEEADSETSGKKDKKSRKKKNKKQKDNLEGSAGVLYEQYIAAREVSGEKWAFAIYSPTSDTLWCHNASDSLQSASVIKLFIMGAVYERMCYPSSPDRLIPFQESYEGELRSILESMITISSNEAANRLIDALGKGDTQAGKEVVNEFCKDHGYTSTHLGRKFLESAPTDDNYTSAYDTAKLLSEILQGTLVNEEASGKMLEILKGQTVRTKIPTGLPGDFTSANKTGEMPEGYGLGCIENDTAIIWPSNAQPYVLTVLSNDLGGRNDEAIQTIRNIASFTAQHVQEWETGKAPEN